MGKPTKKPTTKVESAPATTKPLKKGKRDAEDHLDIKVNPKKQKKELVSALHKLKANAIKAPKKVDTSSSNSLDSEEENKAKAETNSSADEEESIPEKKQPATPKNAKAESNSSEDESSSDEESALANKQPLAVEKAKVQGWSSEDESSSDEETAAAQKQPVVKKVVNPMAVAKDSSSSEDESEEESEDEKEPATQKLSKSDRSSDSSEEDYGDEESDDGKTPKKMAKVSLTKTSKQESNSDESDEEASEDEKDSDIEMVEAEQKSNAPVQPKTPTTHTKGGVKTLFVGNLSYQVERSDVENFFKKAGDIVDVRLASNEDGSFRGFAHVEFASAEAAQKALKLSGKPLLGRDVRLSLAKEKGEYHTAQSSNSGNSGREAVSQSKTIFVNGFDASLSEKEIKRALRDHFGTCGEVTRIVLPADRETGAIRGMAFLDFKDGIDKALELSGSEIGGRRIKVGEGRQRGDSSGSISKRGRGRDSSDHFSKRGRGRDSSDRVSKRGRGRDSRGRGRFEPIKSSVVGLAQGKKIVFNDE